MYEVVVEGPEVEIVEKIRKARSKDKDVVRVVEEMKKVGVKELRGNEWKIEGDLVLKKEKIYMLKDEELRVEVIQLHHDVPAVGHEGRWKTVELVMRNYWWPGMTRNIGKYVEGCDLCQRMKNRTEELAGKLKLSEVPQKDMDTLNGGFHHKVAGSSRKGHSISSMRLVVKNDTFCGNNGRNVGRRIGQIVQG